MLPSDWCLALLQAQRPGGGLVAIKALTLRSMQDWRQLELFEREARALQGLRHEGIPRFVEYFEVDTASDRGFFLVQVRGLGCLPSRLTPCKSWSDTRCICSLVFLKVHCLGRLWSDTGLSLALNCRQVAPIPGTSGQTTSQPAAHQTTSLPSATKRI